VFIDLVGAWLHIVKKKYSWEKSKVMSPIEGCLTLVFEMDSLPLCVAFNLNWFSIKHVWCILISLLLPLVKGISYPFAPLCHTTILDNWIPITFDSPRKIYFCVESWYRKGEKRHYYKLNCNKSLPLVWTKWTVMGSSLSSF
jgi:hypothetical protein